VLGEISEITASGKFTSDDLQKREEILNQQRKRQVDQEAAARKQRELERQDERFNRMSQREREQYREQKNQAFARQEAEHRMREFNEFSFDVNLEYKDEFGQEMSKKDV
jgi:U4/U6.U5 tri-snRNP-associated protein 1